MASKNTVLIDIIPQVNAAAASSRGLETLNLQLKELKCGKCIIQ
jgi:hypothetical protein